MSVIELPNLAGNLKASKLPAGLVDSQPHSSPSQTATISTPTPGRAAGWESFDVNSVHTQTVGEATQPENATATEPTIDNEKIRRAIAVLKQEQNLLYGTMVAGGIGFLSAVFYSAIVFWTQKEYTIAVLGIALGIAWAMRDVGKGRSPMFGCAGTIVFVATMMLTNLFILLGLIAREEGMGFFSVLVRAHMPTVLSILPQFLIEAAGPFSILLYSVGAVLCFCSSFEKITREQVIEKYKQLS